MLLLPLREQVVDAGRRLAALGLVAPMWGSLAICDRTHRLIAVKPSGMDYNTIGVADVVVVDFHGRRICGERKPSSETAMFATVLSESRFDAVVHTHSTFATAFAALGLEIPVCLAELAEAVGGPVPVTEYVRFGTEELGREVLRVIGDKRGILLKNHGVLALGSDLSEALYAAAVIEEGARVAWAAMLLGTPSEVPSTEVDQLYRLHWTCYGQRNCQAMTQCEMGALKDGELPPGS